MKFRALFRLLLTVLALAAPAAASNLGMEGPFTLTFGPSTSFGAPTCTEVSFGYGRISNYDAAGSLSGPLTLELWAVIPGVSNYRVASYSFATRLNGQTYLAANSYKVPITTQPPTGTYCMALSLREAGVERSYYYFTYFSDPQQCIPYAFGTVSLVGPANMNPSGNSVSLLIPQVVNESAGGISGTLRVQLFATAAPYNGSGPVLNPAPGPLMATSTLGQLCGRNYQYPAQTVTVPFTAPPAGTWYATLILTEQTASGRERKSWLNFNGTFTSGTPPATVVTPVLSPGTGTHQGCVDVTMTTTTLGAAIRYTLDNTDPTATSTLYAGPVRLTQTKTVKARAFLAGSTDSAVTSATYTVNAATVATPVIAPNGGSHVNLALVTLTCATPGAAIYYTTNNSVPAAATATRYTGPFPVSTDLMVSARAFKECWSDSSVAAAVFDITPEVLAPPAIAPNGGTHAGSAEVTLTSSSPGAVIYYTINGGEPAEGSNIYTTPFTLAETATVRARAFKPGATTSTTALANFTITPLTPVATPVISPNGGTHTAAVPVTLTCATAGAAIRYTDNGNTPDESSTLYSGTFTLSASKTIRTRAYKSGQPASDVATAVFTVNPLPVVATPVISPNGGPFNGSVQVSITCATSSAVIRYTLDGATPTSAHPQYTAPFTLTETKTVKARAFRSGYTDSAERAAVFTASAPTVVTNANDTSNGSLRQVLANAPAGSTITFAPGLSRRTILLTSGQLSLTKNVTIDASLLPGGLMLSGDANNDEETGAGDVRVLHIPSGVTAALHGLTITGGYAADGSGIRNSGVLTLNGCTVARNVATAAGGGIVNTGTMTLNDCTVMANVCGSTAGGIFTAGSLTLNHCTLSGNSTAASGTGGAIYHTSGALTLNNCTISANSAGTSAGGIYVNDGTVTMRHSIIAGNQSPLFSDVWRNTAAISVPAPVMIGNNDSVSAALPAGPLAGTAAAPLRPHLAPLGYYGGPTMTMPPLLGSPAVDASVLLTAPGLDQRGFPRLVGGRLDLGAVEGYYGKSHGAWDVQEIIPASGQITSLAQAESLIAAPGTASVLEYQTQMLNRSDPQFPGGGGFFGNEEPFAADNRTPRGLNGANGGDDDDFVLVARCVLQIYAEDDYTFGFASDDGARLRIFGTTFTSSTRLNATNPADPAHNGSVLSFPGLTGNSDTLGVCHLTPGTYGLEFVTWERGGGAFAEVFMAKGAKTAVDASFRLVGDSTPARGFSSGIVPEPGFQVTVIRDGATTLAEAIADLTGHWNGTSPGVSVKTDTPAVINYHDPERGGSGGHGLPPYPFPGNEPGNDEHFALGAKASLHINTPGIYTFAVFGDDGSRFRIPGTTGWTASGIARALSDGVQVDGCCADGLGQVYLAAGDYQVELIWHEYEGEANLSLWGAWGLHRAFDAGAFSLVGSNPEEGVPLKTGTWDVVTIFDGDDGLPAALTRIYNRWSGIHPGTNAVTASATTINYTDPQNGGGGHGFPQIPFRGHTAGDDNNFSLGARTRLTVTIGGEYTFAMLSDDGARLRITGSRDWTVTSPDSALTLPRALPDGMELTNCCGDVFGTVTLAAGTYDVEFIYNERFGGAYAGLWFARGRHADFNDQFTLLGSGTPPPIQTWPMVIHTGWPAEAQAVNSEATAALTLVGYPLVIETGIGSGPIYWEGAALGWWKWTAPVSGLVQVEVTGAASAINGLAVYTVEPGGALNGVSGLEWRAGRTYWTDFTAVAGTTYLIEMAAWFESPEMIRLRIGPPPAPPANDNFGGAIHLGNAASAAASGSNVGATWELWDPALPVSAYRRSVWHRWTAPHSGNFLVNFNGQPSRVGCHVSTGTALTSLALVSQSTGNSLTFSATAGTTYNFMLDVLDTGAGTYTLRIMPIPVVTSSSVSTAPGGRTFNLGWRSEPFATYRIEQSSDLQAWSPVVTRFSSEGTATDIAITGIPLATPKIFFRVLRE